MRITNQIDQRPAVAVFGYGACGKGVAANFRNAHATSSRSSRPIPVARLRGDARRVRGAVARATRCATPTSSITVTGAEDVVTAADLDAAQGRRDPAATPATSRARSPSPRSSGPPRSRGPTAAEGITTLHLADGRRFHLLTGGHMVNLAGPRPLGNSIESMDLGFALQARCLEAVAQGAVGAGHVVVPVPGRSTRRSRTRSWRRIGAPVCSTPRPGAGPGSSGAGG